MPPARPARNSGETTGATNQIQSCRSGCLGCCCRPGARIHCFRPSAACCELGTVVAGPRHHCRIHRRGLAGRRRKLDRRRCRSSDFLRLRGARPSALLDIADRVRDHAPGNPHWPRAQGIISRSLRLANRGEPRTCRFTDCSRNRLLDSAGTGSACRSRLRHLLQRDRNGIPQHDRSTNHLEASASRCGWRDQPHWNTSWSGGCCDCSSLRGTAGAGSLFVCVSSARFCIRRHVGGQLSWRSSRTTRLAEQRCGQHAWHSSRDSNHMADPLSWIRSGAAPTRYSFQFRGTWTPAASRSFVASSLAGASHTLQSLRDEAFA